jgi:hypothetical protein
MSPTAKFNVSAGIIKVAPASEVTPSVVDPNDFWRFTLSARKVDPEDAKSAAFPENAALAATALKSTLPLAGFVVTVFKFTVNALGVFSV